MISVVPSMTETDRLMASVGVGQWIWDGHTNTLTMDPTCKGFFEISCEEKASEEAVLGRIHADDVGVYQNAIKECQESGSFFCEFRVLGANDQLRYLSGRGHTVEQDGSTFVIKGVFIDVSQNKELETQLNCTRSRMQDMIDGIPGLFSYIDSSYHVQFMSSQYRDIFNRNTDELIDVHIKELIGEQMFAERQARYDKALAGHVVQFEATWVMPNGNTRCFMVTHQPHRDTNGAVIGVITLGIDITERRDVEQVLQRKTEELKRSNLDLEQFAYVASHDLKAPLRAMRALVDWLKDDLEGYREGDVQENLGLLGQRTQRLAILLDDLLAYSRAGRKIGDVRSLHLKSFVEEVATLIAPPEGFRIVADESLNITIQAYHAPLETVLRNLMNNAIKHHPDPEKGLIQVSVKDHGDTITFGVADNGAGIPEEYSEKVFKMFQTLQPRDKCEGSGMGLAIVQRIIDWQGGKVWFHTAAEGGTIFKFVWKKTPQDMLEIVNASVSPKVIQEERDERNQNQAS